MHAVEISTRRYNARAPRATHGMTDPITRSHRIAEYGERAREVVGGRWSGGVGGEHLLHEFDELRRNMRGQRAQRGPFVVEQSTDLLEKTPCHEWAPPRAEFEQNHTEREHVSVRRENATAHRLRRHVRAF